ncbi:ribosome biogenesis GTPase Der [Candidatus Sumerlaeota bacterium]|nr:ribosome biogenesis GTPase Der [Candidatus Sumerlaeota bacterium]
MKRRKLPIVAIIGRPNVGKSTLFNRIIGRRKANVLDIPGLTRDRNYAPAEWNGWDFFLVDTGGYDPGDQSDITTGIREQVLMAVEEAQAVIFLTEVDHQDNPVDAQIVELLRSRNKPFFLAVNKCDNSNLDNQAYAFSSLGGFEIYPISASHGLGIGTLLDAVTENLPRAKEEDDDDDEIKIAIVGKQNVGKSTLVNKILGKTRMIAASLPGTTRDAVDTPYEYGGNRYLLIDTAGIRRRGRITNSPEYMSVASSIMSIQRCDVAVLLLDASQEISAQDAHIGGYILEAGCGAIIAVNKWDLLEKDNATSGAFAKKIKEEFSFIPYAPILFLSAKSGQRAWNVFNLVDDVMTQYTKRIDTSDLNRELEYIVQKHNPPIRKGQQLKIKYITQTAVAPPTFTLFVNNPKLLHFSYERYLLNQLRTALGFDKSPLRLKLRRKSN